jgi:mRNA-degrading endonuclease RelE of RelBE toxin-antitoxin system
MALELRWDFRVPEGLRALPDSERRLVTRTILSLLEDPWPRGACSLPGKPTWFRLEEGPFSLVYALDPEESALTVYGVTKDGELLGPDPDG